MDELGLAPAGPKLPPTTLSKKMKAQQATKDETDTSIVTKNRDEKIFFFFVFAGNFCLNNFKQ
jgi:hypothetical protein